MVPPPYGSQGFGGYGYGQGFGAPPPPPLGEPAQVWPWYVAYAIAMAILYLACLGLSVFLFVAGASVPSDPGEPPPEVMAVVLGVIALPLFALYAAAPFLPKKPWAWTFHCVLICISLTSACCMIAGIPLLIYWMKPETKAMFGKNPM